MALHLALVRTRAADKRLARKRRVRRLRPVVPNARAEMRYKAALLSLVHRCTAIVAGLMPRLKAAWPTEQPEGADGRPFARDDLSGLKASIKSAAGRLGGLDKWSKRMVGLAVEANRENVDSRLAEEIRRAIGVDVSAILRGNAGMLQSMKAATKDNIALIKTIPEQYFDRVTETVTNGWNNGMRWETLVKQIERDGGITENRAKLIARDQTSKMNAAFNQERQQQVGIEKYEWSTSRDERVRPEHEDMDGKTCRWDDPPIVDGEPAHPGEPINCFPGDSQIQFAHAVEKAYRRRYCGDLAEVVTASGKSLRATPNHPVLTLRGWLPVGSLREGDYVVEVADEVLDQAKEDQHERVSTISEVFAAAQECWIAKPSNLRPADFHGDGADGDVDVVLATGLLSFDAIGANKSGQHLALPMADDAGASARSALLLFQRVLQATHRCVRGVREFLAFTWAQALHPKMIGLGAIAYGHASGYQSTANHAPVNSEAFGYRQFAFAGDVLSRDSCILERKPVVRGTALSRVGANADRPQLLRDVVGGVSDGVSSFLQRLPFGHQLGRVLQVRRIDGWVGHVFNLQTSCGWYATNGIIAHNCRCAAIPIVDEAALSVALEEAA